MKMRKSFMKFALLLGIGCLVSCSMSDWDDDLDSDDFNAKKPQIATVSSIELKGDGTPQRVLITSNCGWVLSLLGADWLWCSDNENGTRNNSLYIDDKSYSGAVEVGKPIYIGASPNPSLTQSRTAVATLTDGLNDMEITITQEPMDEQLSVEETSVVFSDYYASTRTVNVNSNIEWSVESDADWCTVSKYNNAVRIQVSNNNSFSTRTATVTVSGEATKATISVSQAGASAPVLNNVIVCDITKNSASVSFSFSSDLRATRYGVCYSSADRMPTTGNNTVERSSSSYGATVTLQLMGLPENTTFYLRPYVETAQGTTYGTALQFTTQKTNSPGEEDNPTPNY